MTPGGEKLVSAAEATDALREQRVGEAVAGAKIVAIDVVRSELQPNVTHVIVTDSEGFTGLGETFYGASSVEAHVADVIAPTLVSDAPAATPSDVARVLHGYVGYAGSGTEVRARSAIDIALWDIAAKRLGVPLRELLRPDAASSIPVYNTCSGQMYINQHSRQSTDNWGIGSDSAPEGRYEDLWGFLNRPGELAQDLVDEGYRGMKVWPFDIAAEQARGGVDIDLSFGLSVLEKIRAAVGDTIDLYLELHSLLNLDAAHKLVRAVEQFDLAWIEDPIRADRVSDLRALKDSSSSPLAVGENLGAGANGYPLLIEARAVDTLIVDLGWGGGITEALPMIDQTHTAGMNIAYHDCTGPVSLAVAGEVALASPTAVIQEVARSFWHTWYREMATGLPEISGGQLVCGDGPGHGVTLKPEFLQSPATSVRRISLDNG